jgi:hypothetical protein
VESPGKRTALSGSSITGSLATKILISPAATECAFVSTTGIIIRAASLLATFASRFVFQTRNA